MADPLDIEQQSQRLSSPRVLLPPFPHLIYSKLSRSGKQVILEAPRYWAWRALPFPSHALILCGLIASWLASDPALESGSELYIWTGPIDRSGMLFEEILEALIFSSSMLFPELVFFSTVS